MKRDPAGHTSSYRMHLPQDDGYKQIPGLVSDFSLTLESSSDAEKRKKTPKKVMSQRPKTDDYRFNKQIFRLIKPHGIQQIQKRKMSIKSPLIYCDIDYSAQPDQTQTSVEGWAEHTGSDGGSRKAPDAERSTELPTEPSFSSSEYTAGGHIPHPVQKQSCPHSKWDKWKVLGILSVFLSLQLLSECCNLWRSVFHPCQSSSDAPAPVFLAEPAAVVFTHYTVGQVYEVGCSFFHDVQSFTRTSKNIFCSM